MSNQNSSGFRLIRWFVAGAALGAASVYFFDPDQGRRRRVLFREQAVRRLNDTGESFAKSYRNYRNQAQGFIRKIASSMKDYDTDNETLLNRVRSRLGHHVTHPRAVFVRVHDGEVILTGHILANEVDQAIRRVGDVPGVKHVLNHLEIHESSGSIPGLQGESTAVH